MLRALFAIVVMAAAAAAAAEEAPAGRLPQTVAPTHYRLSLTLDPRQAQFTGETSIDVELRVPLKAIWLHGLGLKVQSVTISAAGHTRQAHYEEVDHETGVARVLTSAAVGPGKAVLHFRYSAPFQSAPQGIYRARVGNDWYAFSQMEPIDARRAFPGFDEPGFKTPFDIAITTARADLAVTNTPEVKATKMAGGTTRRSFATTKPLPTYLTAFVAGPLQVLSGAPIAPNSVRHTPLPLRVIGTQGDAARFKFALAQAPELIRRLESYFGTPFPYPKIDLIAATNQLGAMENAGAIIFDEALLAFPPEPTPRQASNFGTVAAHELAHQWFGDLVTPLWWDDIWLNESFAEWMGVKIADDWRPDLGIGKEQLNSTLEAMNVDALRVGRPIHQPIATNAQIASSFDSITYQKGAGVLGMVESYLGEERFQRGVRLHLSRHAYASATAADFFAAMGEGSGERAITDAFESFVEQAGVPLVTVSKSADGALQLEQSRYRALGSAARPDKELWKIPFCAHLYSEVQSTKHCTLLTARTGTLALPAALRTARMHPNADGAGYYRFALTPELSNSLLAMANQLPAREALTLADSTSAAFAAGRTPFEGLFATAQVLAAHPDRTATLSLGYKLDELHDSLAKSPEERTLLERALVSLYGERLHQLGYDPTPGHYAHDPAEQQLLRRQLIGLVGLSGRSAEVRTALAPAAQPSVADPAAVESLFRWRIWAIGLRERGAPILTPLKGLAENRDPQVRQDAGVALASAETPAIANDTLAFALDPSLEVSLAMQIVIGQANNPYAREGAWSWIGTNREALLARMPDFFKARLANAGGSFCSSEERQRFNQVLGERLRGAQGGQLAVDRVTEAIDDCIALRAAVGDSIKTTLEKALH
ncbi:MAG TPA: M1 family metallopeptidase [Steroidobacteraceae bacterium]|nr:M1 family metallopeptidase [Steroidobacteraceae bacterium]